MKQDVLSGTFTSGLSKKEKALRSVAQVKKELTDLKAIGGEKNDCRTQKRCHCDGRTQKAIMLRAQLRQSGQGPQKYNT